MLKQLLPRLYRRLRKRAELSQIQLATLLKIHRNTVVNWEAGKARPDLPQEQAILNFAQCSAEQLAELLCEEMSELLGKRVWIGAGGYQSSTALAKARAAIRLLGDKIPAQVARTLDNQVHNTQLLGIVFERSNSDLEELAVSCLKDEGEDQ